MLNPGRAEEVAAQMQLTLGHRVVSWQEREKFGSMSLRLYESLQQ